MDTQEPANQDNETRSLTWVEYLISGWPLALVAVGGLIGGLCGVGAYAINTRIIRQTAGPMKYVLTAAVGFGAVVLYFAIAFGLALAFPGLFAR